MILGSTMWLASGQWNVNRSDSSRGLRKYLCNGVYTFECVPWTWEGYAQVNMLDPGGGWWTPRAEPFPVMPNLDQSTPGQCKDLSEIISNCYFKSMNYGVVCNIAVSNHYIPFLFYKSIPVWMIYNCTRNEASLARIFLLDLSVSIFWFLGTVSSDIT